MGNAGKEVVVYGWLQQDFVAGDGQRPDEGGEGRDNSGDRNQPIGMQGKAMSLFPPANDGIVEPLRGMGVSEDSMCHPVFQCLLDGRGCPKIHVGNPHGKYIRSGAVPFDAIRMLTINRVVKVIIHWLFYKAKVRFFKGMRSKHYPSSRSPP